MASEEDPSNAPTVRELAARLGVTVQCGDGDAPTVLDAPASRAAAGKEAPLLGRYPVAGRLGAGGMGDVLEVLDRDLGRPVAAKVILGTTDDKKLARFILEAQVTGQLEHPNIVPLHELGMTSGGQLYFTMKKIEGRTLERVLAEGDRASSASSARLRAADGGGVVRLVPLVQILLKICDALAFAHSRGVIHRDLKPANVMVGRFGEVMVCDWGLAKVLGAPDPAADGVALEVGAGRFAELAARGGQEAAKTLDGSICGTPQYMPPEQAAGEIDKLDARSDVYSLGAMLYQALCGQPPYDGPNVWHILHQIATRDPEPPSQVAPERRIPWDLEAVVQKALARRRGERYRGAGAMKRDLEAWLEGRLVQAAHYTRWQAIKKWAARHRAAVIAGSVVIVSVLGALIGIGYQLRVARQREREAIAARDREADERKVAAAARDEARKRLSDFESMSDIKLVVELSDQWSDLGPQRWKLPVLQAWLDAARAMRGRIPQHQATVARLRGTARRSAADLWQLGLVDRLLQDLKQFVAKIDEVAAWERAARRAAPAATQAWARARAAIQRHPRYGGLVLRDQEDLVPLGPDPVSGLWEFAHTPSGKPPVRGDDGRWRITGETGVVLVLIPGGIFRMGAEKAVAGDNRDPDAQADESPVHPVRLAPFFLAKYELTQGQWKRLAGGANPSRWQSGKTYGGFAVTLAHPVDQVSWDDCRQRLARAGLALPTEAQWEYAARGGTRTVWWTGNDTSRLKEAGNLADATYARIVRGGVRPESWDDRHAITAPVGSFLPNAFGLHDVIGNVNEWCRDPFDERAYTKRPEDDEGLRKYPGDPASAARVNRGGGWPGTAISARSANRSRYARAARYDALGCRAARRIH